MWKGIRIIARLLAGVFGLAAAVLFVVGVYMQDANPKIRCVWQTSAIAGLAAFLLEAILRWVESKEAEIAQLRLENHITDLKGNLREAGAKIVELAPRALTDAQRQILLDACRAFPGQKIITHCMAGDPESHQYAQQFRSVFVEAGWDAYGIGQSNQFYDAGCVGVVVSEADVDKGFPPAALALIQAIGKAKINGHGGLPMAIDANLPAGEFFFSIGVKSTREATAALISRLNAAS